MKVEFAPGCFDSFEGTQEELDELVTHIRGLVESGEIFEQSKPVDLSELSEEDLKLINSSENRKVN